MVVLTLAADVDEPACQDSVSFDIYKSLSWQILRH